MFCQENRGCPLLSLPLKLLVEFFCQDIGIELLLKSPYLLILIFKVGAIEIKSLRFPIQDMPLTVFRRCNLQ